jgi:Armadillo/beta-catenin-like repeat
LLQHDPSQLKHIFQTALSLVGNNNLRNKVDFVDQGGIDSVLLVMNWHKFEAVLQELGCAISLSLMSNNDEIVETFVEAGGIQAIVRTMKRFPNHTGIQEHSCGTIWNLLASKQLDTKAEFEKVGGIACLISALRTMVHHAGVIEQACGAAWNLISGESAGPKNAFSEGGGMECLIAAMNAHPLHEQIQEYACGAALRLMASNEESVNVFAEHGGIDSIFVAIETFNDKPAVLLQAYGAAWHFMRDNGTRTAVIADDSIDDSEGIECVMEVMKENNFCREIDEADVRKGRITVSVSNDRRDMFASAGGLTWLIDTLDHYRMKNADLLEQCLRTTIHLISDSVTFKNAFAQAGGVQYIVDGMQYHAKDKAIQQLGCEVLLSLSVVDNIFSGLDACDVLSVLHAARGSFSSEIASE